MWMTTWQKQVSRFVRGQDSRRENVYRIINIPKKIGEWIPTNNNKFIFGVEKTVAYGSNSKHDLYTGCFVFGIVK